MSEPPITHFVRSAVLLATLVAIPGLAICWNHLPKRSASLPNMEVSRQQKNVFLHLDSNSEHTAAAASVPLLNVQPEYPAPPLSAAVSADTETPVQQVALKISRQETAAVYANLERRLKELGARYYRLEKWGNRGELFRFSCFVAASEPVLFEKHFQHIGTDEIRIMELVIADIERWKKLGRQN